MLKRKLVEAQLERRCGLCSWRRLPAGAQAEWDRTLERRAFTRRSWARWFYARVAEDRFIGFICNRLQVPADGNSLDRELDSAPSAPTHMNLVVQDVGFGQNSEVGWARRL